MADIPSYWQLEQAGQWSEGVRIATHRILGDASDYFHYCARAQFLLNMGHTEEALADLMECYRRNPLKIELCLIGVANWWLKRSDEAILSWSGFAKSNEVYTEFPGFVTSPTFLFFAGVRIQDGDVEREARNYLERLWTPERRTVWPFPIAGFLLREMDEDTFLENQTFSDPTLEGRRLCRALFWAGLRELEQGSEVQYYSRLKQAIDLRDSVPAVTLQAEYWLARAELDLREDRYESASSARGT
jgi:hypothetical protein